MYLEVYIEKVLNELRYYKLNNQVCVVNQKTWIILKFVRAMNNLYD